MSDTWLGPGWWMAEDGLWYPPRTAKNMTVSDETDASGRWSRRSLDEEEPPSLLSSGGRIVRAALDPRAEDSVVDLRSNDAKVVELDEAIAVDSIKIDPESVVDAHVMDLDAIYEEVARDALAEQEELVSSVPVAEAMAERMSMTHPAPSSERPAITTATGQVPTPPVRPDDGRPKLEFHEQNQDPGEDVDSPAESQDRTVSIEDEVRADDGDGENVVGSFTSRSRRFTVLLAVATLLAIIAGLLGALWVGERSTTAGMMKSHSFGESATFTSVPVCFARVCSRWSSSGSSAAP